MTLYYVAAIAAIPAFLSMLLYLIVRRSNNLVQHTEDMPPGAPVGSQPSLADSSSTQTISGRQRKANDKAARRFREGHPEKAIQIVRKSLTKGDTRWRTLCDALATEANTLSPEDAGRSLTRDVKRGLDDLWSKDLESASQALVYGTWYTALVKEPNSAVADAWRKMGDAYCTLPGLLPRTSTDFRGDAQDCYNHALSIYRISNDMHGQVLTLYAIGTILVGSPDTLSRVPVSNLQKAVNQFEMAASFYEDNMQEPIWADLFLALINSYYALFQHNGQEVCFRKAQESYIKLQGTNPRAASMEEARHKLQLLQDEFFKLHSAT